MSDPCTLICTSAGVQGRVILEHSSYHDSLLRSRSMIGSIIQSSKQEDLSAMSSIIRLTANRIVVEKSHGHVRVFSVLAHYLARSKC